MNVIIILNDTKNGTGAFLDWEGIKKASEYMKMPLMLEEMAVLFI